MTRPLLSGKRVRLDSPTYLFITRQIDGAEWVRRVNDRRQQAGLPVIKNLAAPTHADPAEAKRLGEILRSGPRPKLDSPTYLRITGQIDDRQYRQLLAERRQALGLPQIIEPATGQN